MARVVDFSMDGVNVKLASMTWAQAEKFVEEGQSLLARAESVKPEEWLDRTLSTVCNSLNAANPQPVLCVPRDLKETYDMPTINAMYFRILEISGLKAAAGEVKAA